MGKVGGQAVLEGVMMKAGEKTVTTCRKEDGSLVITDSTFVSVRKKNKFLNLPIIRGVVNMIEMLKLSMNTLAASAEALGIEEEEETRFEKWLKKHFGASLVDFLMIVATVLAVALAVGLFMVLPVVAASGISWIFDRLWAIDIGVWEKVAEGLMKALIFIVYLALVSLMPDIKRTFMYHGAEHKSIACFESGSELTPANAKKYTRFHPRCGTSFMFIMILIGVAVGMIINNAFPDLGRAYLILIRIGILPLVIGIGYEFIMFAGKHDNAFTRALSAPGLWVQRLTTKEPTEDMLEVAIVSIKCALRDEFPEFREFYENREWEPKVEEEVTEQTAEEAPLEITEEATEEAISKEEEKNDEVL